MFCAYAFVPLQQQSYRAEGGVALTNVESRRRPKMNLPLESCEDSRSKARLRRGAREEDASSKAVQAALAWARAPPIG